VTVDEDQLVIQTGELGLRHPLSDGALPFCRGHPPLHQFQPGQSFADPHEGIVRLGEGIEVVAPVTGMDITHTGDLSDSVEKGRRDQIMPAGGDLLDDQIRCIHEDCFSLFFQCMGQKQNRCKDRDDQGIDGHEGEVLVLSPQEGGEGIFEDLQMPHERITAGSAGLLSHRPSFPAPGSIRRENAQRRKGNPERE